MNETFCVYIVRFFAHFSSVEMFRELFLFALSVNATEYEWELYECNNVRLTIYPLQRLVHGTVEVLPRTAYEPFVEKYNQGKSFKHLV